MNPLETALLAAHEAGDAEALIKIYQQAADEAPDADAAAFFLTHAYIFALEAGHTAAPALHQRLIDAGREAPLPLAIAPKL